jgi:peptidoglycan/xylan/chitin deacetylase (PgdA/CDA1 family)
MVTRTYRERTRRRPVASAAVKRARRRRFRTRRISFVIVLLLVVMLLSFGMMLSGSSSEKGDTPALVPVKARTLPNPPNMPTLAQQPDMERVWDDAIAKDPTPGLATHSRIGTSGGRIALTFDDGPDRQTTPPILDELRKHDIEATFFVVGRQVKKNPDLLRRIVAEGHTIGNHTYDHADLSALNEEQMRRELRSTQKAVDDALGYHYPMVLMRPPYGDPYFGGREALPLFQNVVRQERLFPVLWTQDPSDYLYDGFPQGVVQSVARSDAKGRKRAKDQVLLLHDTHGQTMEALPRIIDHYKKTGRQFAGVDELLEDKYSGP